MTVKALFPIGKTQWAKWDDDAREAYNKMRALGYTHETGVAEANAVQARRNDKADKPKKSFFDVIEDVVEEVQDAAETVADVAAVVTPVAAVAKTVVKAVKGKKGK